MGGPCSCSRPMIFAEAESDRARDPLIASGCVSLILHEWRVVARGIWPWHNANGGQSQSQNQSLEPDQSNMSLS